MEVVVVSFEALSQHLPGGTSGVPLEITSRIRSISAIQPTKTFGSSLQRPLNASRVSHLSMGVGGATSSLPCT
jgi:hypothetical protein